MPYIYRVSRRQPLERQPERAAVTVSTVAVEPEAEPEPEVVEAAEPSYRDLQAQAKELGISAKQTKDELKTAIAEAGE